ncbi:SURF1 family protein [Arthrobacter monumenti]
MLKTALKPRWIAALFLALVLSTVFVLLSQWQFSSAQDVAPPRPSSTEQVKPLTEVFEPGTPMLAGAADQMVAMSGHYLTDKQVLVEGRLQDDETGYWVVTAFAVDGAPALEGKGGGANPVIPVARGWIEESAQAGQAPGGELELTGRLLPTEAPIVDEAKGSPLPSLSISELINIWDVASYSGFVVADETLAGGTPAGAASGGNVLEEIQVSAQPQDTPVNWLNIFYAIEWFIFGGFAFFLWWRLVADDYRRGLEEDEYDDDSDRPTGSGHPARTPTSEVTQ